MRSEIADELAKIGELSAYIIEGGRRDESKYDTSLLDNFFNEDIDVENDVEDDYNREAFDESRIIEPLRIEKNVGRNEPCPCGSGKKYKRCCGKK